MTLQPLDQPLVTTSALRSVNFFNGRLLTGDDLQREQATHEARLDRLTGALGTGVAYGLEVEAFGSPGSEPVVRIAPGLALAPTGQALELTSAIDVALDQAVAPASSGSDASGSFGACQPSATATYTAGAGVYLLAIGPAEQGEGRAPVDGLTGAGPCTVSLSAEAVYFRLIRLAVTDFELTDTALLRNKIAYDCFGSAQTAQLLVDPFATRPMAWGAVDALRPQQLSEAEVPLAAIGWSIDSGIEFVDLWSVRRRPIRPTVEDSWAVLTGDRRMAETEAMFLQFQSHLDDLMLGSAPNELVATSAFATLPPFGVLPLGSASSLRPGVDLPTFFSGATARGPVFIDGSRVEPLMRQAMRAAPMSLSEHTLIWVYQVRESSDPNAWGLGSPGGPYVLFTSGEVRYAGQPEFNLARWNYANFALETD
jgi:hypothetical protein